MSQNTLKAMLKAWEKGKKESTVKLPSRFYELRKRRTPRPKHHIGGITPEGEAILARDWGLDKERAKPLAEEDDGE